MFSIPPPLHSTHTHPHYTRPPAPPSCSLYWSVFSLHLQDGKTGLRFTQQLRLLWVGEPAELASFAEYAAEMQEGIVLPDEMELDVLVGFHTLVRERMALKQTFMEKPAATAAATTAYFTAAAAAYEEVLTNLPGTVEQRDKAFALTYSHAATTAAEKIVQYR